MIQEYRMKWEKRNCNKNYQSDLFKTKNKIFKLRYLKCELFVFLEEYRGRNCTKRSHMSKEK